MDTPETLYKGKISLINYDKHIATIDYLMNNKRKTVSCKTDAADSSKKPQHYRLGDEVSFQLRLSDRGDKMIAHNVTYRHNEAISLLLQKAVIENKFSGYLKKIEDQYFVKECDSYIFFPLQLSPWEIPPPITAENEVITFSFVNIDKSNALKAELSSHHYIPEYKKALHHFDKQTAIEATVTKVSTHAVYLNLFNNTIQAKLPLSPQEKTTLQENNKVSIFITHLSPSRIVVKKV